MTRSTSGYVFIASRGAIGWSSRRQSMVALSSTESKYIGLANAGQHLAWLRSFFEELGQPENDPTGCDATTEPQSFSLRIPSSVHALNISSESTTLCEMILFGTENVWCSGIQQRKWLRIFLPKLYLTRSTPSSVYPWDCGLGRVGVSRSELSGTPRPPARLIKIPVSQLPPQP